MSACAACTPAGGMGSCRVRPSPSFGTPSVVTTLPSPGAASKPERRAHALKFSASPGTGQSSMATRRPLPDKVTYSVRNPGPPKQQFVG